MHASGRWMLVGLGVLVGMALAVPVASQSPKQLKKAEKLLAKLKLVDGAGSGLDADTLQGMTPADLRASIDADTLDGVDSQAFARKLPNVVTVATAGGDFTSVQEAIDSITDATSSNRYLVFVGPGIYAGRVTLKPGITVRGSGIDATTLTAGPAASCIDGFTVKGSASATVTDLTIGNSGDGACGVGVLNAGVGFARYRRLLVSTSSAANTTAILNDASEIELLDVELEIGQGSGSGDTIGVDQRSSSSLLMVHSSIYGCTSGGAIYGIRNDDSSAIVRDSDVTAFVCSGTGDRIGILNTNGSGTVNVDRSTVSASTSSIATSAGYTTRVGVSKLAGGAVSGTVTCAQVYDEIYTSFAGPGCP
jgi:hypothetical protein